MTRGNQRDIDRARAQARKEKAGKPSASDKDGLTFQQRKERYVTFMDDFLIRLPLFIDFCSSNKIYY